MKYHAIIEYSENNHNWYNFDKYKIISELLIPFINGQVKLIKTNSGKKLLNLKSVSRLTIYKTPKALKATSEESVIEQMHSKGFASNECTEELIKEAQLDLSNAQTLSLLEKSFKTKKNQVFVIMKFGDAILDSAYKGVIKPLFESYGINVIRVDEIQNSGKINDQILDHIAISKYVLSDLSGERPNCYYETGFAHALGKEVILTVKKADSIHFDLSSHRFIQWATEHELRQELTRRLESIIEDK